MVEQGLDDAHLPGVFMLSTARERLLSGLAAAGAVALLGYLLLLGIAVERHLPVARPAPPTNLVLTLRPPRDPLPARPTRGRPAARPSPPALRNEATDIQAPPPLVLPVLSPVLAAEKPASGAAATAGASEQAGPGTGAGGVGDGRGGGGDGDGAGDSPPRLIRGRLKYADLPHALRDLSIGGSVTVRYRVGVDGRVSGCIATMSSGHSELDAETCRLIQLRFRFEPSRDAQGHAVRSTIEENHSWIAMPSPDSSN